MDVVGMRKTGARALLIFILVAGFGGLLFRSTFRLAEIASSTGLTMYVARMYNYLGAFIAPNQVTVVLFDWRGFDTLGEAMVLVTGVIVTAMLFGRGVWAKGKEVLEEFAGGMERSHDSVIIGLFAYPVVVILIIYGVVITLGGHITPGGGFQGGSIVATAYLLGVVAYGLKRNPIDLKHSSLSSFETLGALTFLLLGLLGLGVTGYFLYNTGSNLGYLEQVNSSYVAESYYEPSSSGLGADVNYPENPDRPYYGPGILPFLNIAVFLKVLGGLSTLVLVLTEAKKE
jgi:energy-converting hydrogenase B subunit I